MNRIRAFLLFGLMFTSYTLISFSAPTNDATSSFLVISDIHLNMKTHHVMEINPTTQTSLNDLDLVSFNTLMSTTEEGIQKGSVAKPHFIILLGDLVAHHLFSSQSVIDNESYLFQYFKKHFPDTPVFYVFGNNDSLSTDYGPFLDLSRKGPLKSPYDVATQNALWTDGFLSTGKGCQKTTPTYPCLIAENFAHGYYSAYIAPKLQLIALNSVLFSPKRAHVPEAAGAAQLQWLRSTLIKAQNNQEQVLLAMHIPPGHNVYDNASFWTPKETNEFLDIIETFHHRIIGILSGHTHKEELKIIRNRQGTPIAGVYLTAALSTFHGNAPSVKTFFYSHSHGVWQLNNYESFSFSKPNDTFILNKLYDYQHYYCSTLQPDLLACLSDITPNKMQRYFNAGNPHYPGTIPFPDAMICTPPLD